MNPEDLNLNPGDYLPDEEINRLFGEFHTNVDPPSTTGAGPSSSTMNSSKKRKSKKSLVWDSFDAIMINEDGIEVERAKCTKTEQRNRQQQSQQQSKLMKLFLNKATNSSALGSGSGSSSQNQGHRQHVELNRYLSTEYSIIENDDFTTNDLLKWWRNKRNSFPILSRLACDVLAIPVSTVSSEAVFSMAGRILDFTRCSLAPDAVEALTCLKDWQNAKYKRQHQMENEELMDDFSNMTIEESSGSNQPVR